MVGELAPQIPPEREMRGPGCDDRCRVVRALVPGSFGRSELLLHSAEAHEEYGRGAPGERLRTGIVVTGGLAIDLDGFRIQVEGHLLEATATEVRLLLCLARRLDRVVPVDEILTEAWGPCYRIGPHSERFHIVRVNVARLRSKLGKLSGLLVTAPHFGYRLAAVSPTLDPSNWPEPPRRDRLQGRWSFEWEACHRCGRTDRAHKCHGYCMTCWGRAYRERLRSPRVKETPIGGTP